MERPKLVPRGGTASSGPDRAQDRARSGGRTLHATEDSTLRLTDKASSCGQEMGHRGYIIGDSRADDCYHEGSEKRDRGVKFQTWGGSTGSQDKRSHGHRNNGERCRIGRRWREGVPFGGPSRDVENVLEPRRLYRGVGSGQRKRLPSRSAALTEGMA